MKKFFHVDFFFPLNLRALNTYLSILIQAAG